MKRKKLVKRPHIWRIVFLFNAVLLFIFALGFGREYVGNMQIEQKISESEEERARLEQENLSMNQLIQELSSEYFLEREGRIKHGLAEDGETLIIVKENDEPFVPVFLEEDEEEFDISNAMTWYFYFFDRATFREISEL